jgi:hypothetical protein
MYFETDELGNQVKDIKARIEALRALLIQGRFDTFDVQEALITEDEEAPSRLHLFAPSIRQNHHIDRVDLLLEHYLPILRINSPNGETKRLVGIVQFTCSDDIESALLESIIAINQAKTELQHRINKQYGTHTKKVDLYRKHPLLQDIRVKTLLRHIPVSDLRIKASTFGWSKTTVSFEPISYPDAVERIKTINKKDQKKLDVMLDMLAAKFTGRNEELVVLKPIKAHPIQMLTWLNDEGKIARIQKRAHTPLLVFHALDSSSPLKELTHDVPENMKLDPSKIFDVISGIHLYKRGLGDSTRHHQIKSLVKNQTENAHVQ